jgi:crossover junction endodeoxyribonuclease RusA
MTLIRCAYPPKPLWPNARPNRFAKARVAKSYRYDCCRLAWAQNVHRVNWPDGKIKIHLTFHPAGSPDDDNLEAAFKSGRDGIADAMGMDDKRFSVTREIASKVKGGCVLVQILTEGCVNVPIIGQINA